MGIVEQYRDPAKWTSSLPRAAATASRREVSEVPSNSAVTWNLGSWRRQALYGILVSLAVVTVINLSLTLWMMRSMRFSLEGIGDVRIFQGGLHLKGDAAFMDGLRTSRLASPRGRSISVESAQNFTVSTRDASGVVTNKLSLGDDKFEVTAREFKITNSRRETLFSANRREVTVGADLLRVTGQGGAVFDGSVQTPLLRSSSSSDLRLESLTRTIQVQASQGVHLESRAGDIGAVSWQDMKLVSTGGSVRIEAPVIQLQQLKTVIPTTKPLSAAQTGARSYQVYQVCICSNGKLFIAAADAQCTADAFVCS